MREKTVIRWAIKESDGVIRVVGRQGESRNALKQWASDDERIIKVEIRELRAVRKKKGPR